MLAHRLVSTRLGFLGLVWTDSEEGTPRIVRLLLPGRRKAVEARLRQLAPGTPARSVPAIDALAAHLQAQLAGEAPGAEPCVKPDWTGCAPFQLAVLTAIQRIPRGRVSSYRRIALAIGCPGGARAVGAALAANPVPLLAPCHRVIRENRRLGGFQGGPDLKRALLALEGVACDAAGQVVETAYWGRTGG